MLAESGNSITFYAFYVESQVGKTGLTVTVDVYQKEKAQAPSLIVNNANVTEIGGGLYYYDLASGSVTVEGEYTAIFSTADTGVDQRDLPAIWVIDRRVKANAIIEVQPGAIELTYTITSHDTGLPIEGAVIWITTDLAGTNEVWRGNSDTFGVARDLQNGKPWLAAGTYYVFSQKAGFYFDNPDTEVVS